MTTIDDAVETAHAVAKCSGDLVDYLSNVRDVERLLGEQVAEAQVIAHPDDQREGVFITLADWQELERAWQKI